MMMKFLSTLTLLALTACAALDYNHAKEPFAPGEDAIDALELVYSQRLEAYTEATLAQSGWPSVSDCDATKWAAQACMGGAGVSIELAEYRPGRIERRPKEPHGTCFSLDRGDLGAKASTSRDMIAPYMACLWERRDLAGLQRLADYGESHDWMMGDPIYEPRVFLGTNLIGLLGRMVYALSDGADDRYYRRLFKLYPKVQEDYEQELQVLGIQLQGDVSEALRQRSLAEPLQEDLGLLGINDQMMARLDELAQANPDNYYFHAVRSIYSGDYTRAVDLLLEDPVSVPSYVRGDNVEAFAAAHWLLAARTVLKRFGRLP